MRFYEEVSNRVQAKSGDKLYGWGRRSEAAGSKVASSRGEDPHLGEQLPPARSFGQ